MEKLAYLIDYLNQYNGLIMPGSKDDFATFRALSNITMPRDLDEKFYEIQDELLQEEIQKMGIVDVEALPRIKDKIALYKGDIVPLKADAIVTAANNELLGCFRPNHHCIDNAIFTYAGLELRREMMGMMNEQKHSEPNGMVKVSKAYNLPSKYVFHTVGPIVDNKPNKQSEIDLRNCYISCLEKANEMKLNSIVFCSISTGVFGYPIEAASKIAITTVLDFFSNRKNTSINLVVFDTFSEGDYHVYQRRLTQNH